MLHLFKVRFRDPAPAPAPRIFTKSVIGELPLQPLHSWILLPHDTHDGESCVCVFVRVVRWAFHSWLSSERPSDLAPRGERVVKRCGGGASVRKRVEDPRHLRPYGKYIVTYSNA